MKTSQKVIISVFSVLLAAAVAVTVLLMNGTIKKKNDSQGKVVDGEYVSEDFSSLSTVSVNSETPIMPCGAGSVFYSVSLNGEIKFYEYNGENLTEYSGEVKTFHAVPQCSHREIPIDIYYIERDGKTIGYGLYTSSDTEETNLYPYVFAKLTDAPELYGVKGKMLLLNTDPDEAYCSDKTYTEIFDADIETGKCEKLFSERDRTVDKTGRMTERWNILTDGYLQSAEKKAVIISGRLYDSETEIYDVFDMNKSTNKPDATGMLGTFLRDDSESGYVYLKRTATGFKSVNYIGDEKEIVSFEGDFYNDFVFSGNWVYSVKDRTFTNLLDGTKITATGTEAIDMFAVSSDSTKIAAVANYKNQAFFVINSDGTEKSFSGTEIFSSGVKNICFADENTVLVTFASDSGCVNRLIKVS